MAAGFPTLENLSNINIRGSQPTTTFNAENFLQQIAQMGFSQEQFNTLMQQLTQQLGAAQGQNRAILGQQLASAPRGVRQGALASSQNQFLGALQRGTTGIQAQGMQRQLQALLPLLQAQMQRYQIESQKEAQLLGDLLGLGTGIGSLLIHKPK